MLWFVLFWEIHEGTEIFLLCFRELGCAQFQVYASIAIAFLYWCTVRLRRTWYLQTASSRLTKEDFDKSDKKLRDQISQKCYMSRILCGNPLNASSACI